MALPRRRAAVLVLDGSRVAVIERIVPDRVVPYYLFPGGQAESGETPPETARREAEEELGLQVRIEGLLAVSDYRGSEQHYYLASVESGTFGSGHGEEMANLAEHPQGTYRPVWLECSELLRHDVRPRSLAARLQAGLPPAGAPVLRISD